jgi:hypothetical protein
MNPTPRSWIRCRHGGHGLEMRHSSGVSRRQFLSTTAGLALGAGLSTAFGAQAGNPHVDASPLPPPGGISPFGVFIHHRPIIPNSVPLSALNEPSQITNFNGFVALNRIRGTGSSPDFPPGSLTFQADIGFMDGEYVAQDGKHYQATFGFF